VVVMMMGVKARPTQNEEESGFSFYWRHACVCKQTETVDLVGSSFRKVIKYSNPKILCDFLTRKSSPHFIT